MNSNVLGRQWYPVPGPAEMHQSAGDDSLTTLTRSQGKTWNLLHETPDVEHESAVRARTAKRAQRKASRRINRL